MPCRLFSKPLIKRASHVIGYLEFHCVGRLSFGEKRKKYSVIIYVRFFSAKGQIKFSFCGPYSLCCNYLTLLLWCSSSHRQ